MMSEINKIIDIGSILSSSNIIGHNPNPMNNYLLDLEVFEVVSNFNLSKSVVPFLADRGLTKRSLFLLRSEHMSKIFPDSELGLQLEFEDELLKWKNDELRNCNTICSGSLTEDWIYDLCCNLDKKPTSRRSSKSSNISSNLTQVKDILSLSLAGKDVLDNYNSNKALTNRQQRQIVQLVIEYYGLKSQRLSTSQLDSIARDIASTFHREDKSTYFIPKSSKYAHPTGMLYNAYHNFNRGKTKYAPRLETSATTKQDTTSSLPAPEISEEQFEQFKLYLKFNDRPWEIVQEKWEKTAPYRLKEIRKISDKNSLNILNEWPLYKHSGSYLLINIDFQSMHNVAYNKLFLKHNELNNLLLKYYQSEGGLRNRVYKKQLPEICLLDENSRTFPLFNFLSTVIAPKQYIKCPGKPGWKVNIKDSEKSFVLRCSQENDILSQVEVEKNKCLEYKIPYQPSIIAVGESILTKTDFYIYFYGSLLKFNNFISCLDI